MEKIKSFVLELIENEYSIKDVEDIDSFNYVENGYIDSIGLLGFMADIEDQFGITFSDEELNSKEFQVIGSLVEMIYEKINN